LNGLALRFVGEEDFACESCGLGFGERFVDAFVDFEIALETVGVGVITVFFLFFGFEEVEIFFDFDGRGGGD
jgi:hypothetical protein